MLGEERLVRVRRMIDGLPEKDRRVLRVLFVEKRLRETLGALDALNRRAGAGRFGGGGRCALPGALGLLGARGRTVAAGWRTGGNLGGGRGNG